MSDTITVTGNIATDPDFKRTPAGVAITGFRVASSQRRFDRNTGAWVDGVTNFYSVSTFRGLAEHAFASFKKGDRVLLTGRLRLREWDNGTKRGTTAEIDAEAIGHDLLWGTTTFVRASSTADGARADAPDDPRDSQGVSDAWAVPGSEVDTGLDAGTGLTDERPLVAAGAETPF
ncbi:single-stranded DNA-binding protein [uncultured Microbacterium sp.]|uniref:single-stranded DNA-binding protein n=1 Tax=uncultured Microbacterium sp. TaxID=191216 RepID=UPI0035CB7694